MARSMTTTAKTPGIPARAAGRRMARNRGHAPIAYFAHPKLTYGDHATKVARRLLSRQLLGWEILDPEHIGWESNEEWRSGWDELVKRLSALVVMPDAGGMIGAGCLREIADAFAVGVSVVVWSQATGRLLAFPGVTIPSVPTPGRCAQVLGGVALGDDPGTILLERMRPFARRRVSATAPD